MNMVLGPIVLAVVANVSFFATLFTAFSCRVMLTGLPVV